MSIEMSIEMSIKMSIEMSIEMCIEMNIIRVCNEIECGQITAKIWVLN